MGPLHERQKNNLTQSHAEQFHAEQFEHIFFQLVFDTATRSILKLRMLKARGCTQRLKSDISLKNYMHTLFRAIPNEEKKITNPDFFVVNRDFFCRDSRQIYHESRHEFFSFSLKKIKSRFDTFCRGSTHA